MRRSAAILLACCWIGPAAASPYGDAGASVIHIHIEGMLKVQPAEAKTKFYSDDATGFLVSPDGLIMTAGHVVPSEDDFEPDTLVKEGRFPQAIPHGGFQANDPAFALRIVKASRTPYDVGLLRIVDPPQRPLKFLRLCDDYTVGDTLTFLGYLRGQHLLSSRKASVSAPATDPDPIQIEVRMTKGDSGGPFINDQGGVIAIGIGELQINNERVNEMNLGVWMHNAIAAMSPETAALIGTSYDPQCSKKLSNPGSPDSDLINVGQRTGVSVAAGQTTTVTQTFQAPEGKVFADIVDSNAGSTSDIIAASPSGTTIAPDGKTLQMRVQVSAKAKAEAKSTWTTILNNLGLQSDLEVPARASVDGRISARVKQAPNDAVVASSRPDVQLQSFLVSRTLDAQPANSVRQTYAEEIPAPPGYRFERVVRVDVMSSSHATSGLEASIANEGNAIRTTFALESGTVDNPWKAWIDAFVTASMAPANTNR